MAKVLFIFFATFLFHIDSSEACSCIVSHPQTNYCESDFVIKATPVERIPGNSEIDDVTYVLTDIEYLKANGRARAALKKSRVTTASSSAACGVELELNRVYLLVGGVNKKKAELSLCSFNALWDDVPEFQRQGFQEGYAGGCNCNIEYCFTIGDGCGEPANNKCVMDSFCYSTFGSCLSSSGGNCEWTSSTDLDQCIAAGGP